MSNSKDTVTIYLSVGKWKLTWGILVNSLKIYLLFFQMNCSLNLSNSYLLNLLTQVNHFWYPIETWSPLDDVFKCQCIEFRSQWVIYCLWNQQKDCSHTQLGKVIMIVCVYINISVHYSSLSLSVYHGMCLVGVLYWYRDIQTFIEQGTEKLHMNFGWKAFSTSIFSVFIPHNDGGVLE